MGLAGCLSDLFHSIFLTSSNFILSLIHTSWVTLKFLMSLKHSRSAPAWEPHHCQSLSSSHKLTWFVPAGSSGLGWVLTKLLPYFIFFRVLYHCKTLYIFFISLFLSPLLKFEFHKGRNYCLFCLFAYFPDIDYCLVHSKHSLNIHLVIICMNVVKIWQPYFI